MNPAAALADHLQLAVSKQPTSLALRHAGQTWTFSEWQAEVQALVATRPTTPGPMVLAGNSLELARHAYACSFQNRPFFPVDRSTSAHHLAHRKTPPLSDVALIISTSGSEGQARGILLGNAQLDAAAAASNQRLPLRPGDLWLNCLPLYHIGGQSILWRCARAGAAVLLHDGFAAEHVAADLASHPVTHISLVPAMLARLLDIGAMPPPSLRIAMIGGAAFVANTLPAGHRRWLAALPQLRHERDSRPNRDI